MNPEVPPDATLSAQPPISSYDGPVAELIRSNMLGAPAHIGLLAGLDHYEILEMVGRGGMGLVFKGRDTRNGMTVAIKMIRNDVALVEALTSRFIKEATHLQKLRHPNVVPVLDMSDNPKRPYFVMPFFERGSLAKHIANHRQLEPETITEVARNIAEALSFAHRRGIIHRDLKPANVLLTSKGTACLSDFGLALTMFNDSVVDIESRQIDGTAPYLSPAVAAGDAEDTRRDIYAFGAVLYEMLSGAQPYTGETTREIRTKIVAGPPPDIRALNPKADPNLTIIANGAMAREVRARYADMAEVIEDLDRVKVGQKAIGPRIGGRKFRLGGRQALAAVAVITLAIAGATAGVLWKRSHAAPPSPAPSAPVAGPTPSADTPSIAPTKPAASITSEPVITQSAPPPRPAKPIVVHGVSDIAVGANGEVLLAERDRQVIEAVQKDGGIRVFAGLPGVPGTTDGPDGRFSMIRGITTDRDGDVIVTDAYRIRKISRGGNVSSLAGVTGQPGETDGPSDGARFEGPAGICIDDQGNIIVADMYAIRGISSNGNVTTIAGGKHHSGGLDGPGSAARFGDRPKAITFQAPHLAYVADAQNCTVRRVDLANGIVTTVAGLRRHPGFSDGPGVAARFERPAGIAAGPDGAVYVADEDACTIRKISADGAVSTIAGAADNPGFSDGTGAAARFNHPSCLAFDGVSRLLVFDSGNSALRAVSLDGTVATLNAR